MKTSYRPRSNVSSKSKRLSFVAAVFLIGVIIVLVLRTPLFAGVTPLWRGANAFSARLDVWFGLLNSKEEVIKENESLKQQINSLNLQMVALQATADSRESLFKTYGRSASSTGVAAGVLVHPPETPYDVLVVDAGQAEGIHEGERVFLPEGVLLGTVSAVGEHEAHVTLYSSSGLKTDAVLERGGVAAVLVGQGGGNYKIDLPKDVSIKTGDRILAPGLAAELLGVVGDVETTPTDSALHAYIRSVASVSSVRYVLIKP